MSSLTHQRRYLTASGLNTRWLSTEVCWPCSEQSEVGSTLKREGWGGCILVLQKCSNRPGKTNAFDWRKSLLARGSQCLCCLISFFRKKKKVRVKTFQMQTGEMICVNGRRVDCWGGWIWPSVLILPFFAKGSMFLDSDDVCSVAVLLTVCIVLMWKRLCIWSGWGMETRALALYSWFLLYSAAYSVVNFSLLAENFWFLVLNS